MRVSNPFRYKFREPHPNTSCVFRVWFGKKFLIWKCKALHQSVNTIAMDLDRRLRLGVKDDDLYKKAVGYINRGRVTLFEVEVVLTSDDPVVLLQEEYRLFQDGRTNPDCLNETFMQQMPKWMPESTVSEFTKWKESLALPTNPKAKKNAAKNAKTVPAGRGD